MTANDSNPDTGQERTGRDATTNGDSLLFDCSEGLFTTADLGFGSGTSPVRMWAATDSVHLEVGVGPGTVTVRLTPERAAQLGDALRHAANKTRAHTEAEADE